MNTIFKINVTMYVEAMNADLAAGVAELNVYAATEAIRKRNSSWVEDKVSFLETNGIPIAVDSIPTGTSYKKEGLVKAFGEGAAIKFLLG